MNDHNNYCDDHSPLVDDAASRQDKRVNVVIEDPQNQLPRYLAPTTGIVAIVILAATLSFCSLELHYLATFRNTTTCRSFNFISNSILIVYLSLVIAVVVVHLVFIVRNSNWLEKTKFRNYPMLMILILIGCINITYYMMMLLTNVAIGDQLSSIYSTATEFLFGGAILPFVILCVCYKVPRDHPRIRMTTATTMFACIGGCLMVFVKRVSGKIIRHFNVSCVIVNGEYKFLHEKAEYAEYILNRVDTTYILISFVFLVYLLLNYRRDVNQSDQGSDPGPDFLVSLTYLKYRWPTLVVSTILVGLFLCSSYMIPKNSDSDIQSSTRDHWQIIFLSVTMAMFVVSIVFVLAYKFTGMSNVTLVSREYARSDVYFSRFTAVVQMIYGMSMIGYYIWIYEGTTVPTVYMVRMVVFLLLIIQVAAQLWYIDSAIKKTGIRRDVSKCNSLWFPPVALAMFNFGIFVHKIVYPGNIEFSPLGDHTLKFVYCIIEDFLSPIALLNRLHGMAFFINLTLQQWHDN